MKTNKANYLERTITILDDLILYEVLGGKGNLAITNYVQGVLEENNIVCQGAPNRSGSKMSIHFRMGPRVDRGTIFRTINGLEQNKLNREQ